MAVSTIPIIMLLGIAVILILFWLIGLFAHIAGGLIHLVLVIALVMFVLHFVRGRSRGV